jgi:hypothetical protein
MRILAFIIGVSISLVGFSQTNTVAEKILEFSKKNLGKKVERGECWDLASSALNYANANWKPLYDFGDKFDYKKQDLKPGDILQFTNVKFMFPNGSASFPKHTAIVYKANKQQLVLLHQNFNNKRYVDTLSINLENIKNGKIESYRPRMK